MLIGKVIGTVVSTRKEETLKGLKFLLLRPTDEAGKLKAKDDPVVAADAVGAGVGELVLYATGSASRQTHLTDERPVDAVIMAIVDMIDKDGNISYNKAESE